MQRPTTDYLIYCQHRCLGEPAVAKRNTLVDSCIYLFKQSPAFLFDKALFHKLLHEPVEYTIDEVFTLVGAILFGNFKKLIEGHLGRDEQ